MKLYTEEQMLEMFKKGMMNVSCDGEDVKTPSVAFNEALIICNSCEKLPCKYEINFDGNLLTEIETTDKNLKFLKAMNGFGNAIDTAEIQINEVQR